MGVLRSGARGNMPATAKRLASWRVLKEMLQSFLRRCSLLDVLESLTVGTCVQHFFQVLSRGGGSLAQVFACPGHNFFFPCPILRFACPVFVDKCSVICQNAEISNDFSVFFIGYNIPVLVYFLLVLIFYTSSGIFQKNHLTFLPERV